jgi:hypothetical protein
VNSKIKVFLFDLAERVGSTFAQVFLATLLSTTVHVTWVDAAAVAGLSAFASFLTTILVWLTAMKGIPNPYLDLFYRGGVTFLQTLAGYVTAAGAISAFDFTWSLALKTAAIAAGTSLLKGLIGLNNGRTLGASPLVLRHDGSERPRPHPHPLVA